MSELGEQAKSRLQVLQDTRPPDAELAANFRKAAEAPLRELCTIMDEAKRMGLVFSFSVNPDQFGRCQPTTQVIKPL